MIVIREIYEFDQASFWVVFFPWKLRVSKKTEKTGNGLCLFGLVIWFNGLCLVLKI